MCSFDNRAGRSGRRQHWADVRALGQSRVSYRPDAGHLVISGSGSRDQGRYRCRVDFRGLPTATGDLQLSVIGEPAPPQQPKLYLSFVWLNVAVLVPVNRENSTHLKEFKV